MKSNWSQRVNRRQESEYLYKIIKSQIEIFKLKIYLKKLNDELIRTRVRNRKGY